MKKDQDIALDSQETKSENKDRNESAEALIQRQKEEIEEELMMSGQAICREHCIIDAFMHYGG